MFISILLSSFFVDRITKDIIQEKVRLGSEIRVTSFLNITHTRNRGIIFGLLSDVKSRKKGILLNVFSVTAFVILLMFALKLSGSDFYLLSAMLGGAFGNVYDRITKGYVVDFIDMHISKYHWPSYNFADAVITIGIFFLIVRNLTGVSRTKESVKR